ncbi:Uncharacterised protein [Serratia proteamaculans]|uniref:hypothetical protein n=1 Tax=Serratia proteamaculans TaxID=28151 RepID=UPI00217B273A|nr:hypothetical protein [Serratia proteamaculans]CAI1701407.1 Uncharacterised protein [Serratia proteamaculans]
MNDRDLSIIRVMTEEFSQALLGFKADFDKQLEQQRETFTQGLTELKEAFAGINPMTADDVKLVVENAVKALPPTEVPVLPDVSKMVSEAVAALPVPADGKSLTQDDIRPLLKEMVEDAVSGIPAPRDGKDADPEAIKSAVSDALAALPAPESPVPGADGRDALQIEILPGIYAEKSYPRGTYATHSGGLWRSFEKTAGMRGWECLVDGISTVDVTNDDERMFTVTVTRASGACETKTFGIPVMIYRGVFKSEGSYQPGDTVTWGGSLWHCDETTADKPGEIGSKGWTLATKRGRDGKDKT